MTELMRMAGFAVTAALIAFTLRAAHRQAGAAVAMAAGLMLAFTAVTHLSPAVEALEGLSRRAGVGEGTAKLLLKLVAMAYISEFAVQACRDAGEEGLGAKVSLCGKMLLMLQTLPLITEIGDIALNLAP